jgi:anti-sigma regulatory factor (Ser/Thr protein kinase)
MPASALRVDVVEASQVGAARRAVAALAEQAGLAPAHAGRAALLATELATNLLRHAQQGHLLLRLVDAPSGLGIELLAVDRGPGMADVGRCLVDGYSSGSSPGTGLGAIRRSADQFDVHSRQPEGSVLVARVWTPAAPSRAGATVDWGVVSQPLAGEFVCGDAWHVVATARGIAFLVADGLGHGALAAAAADQAVDVLREHPDAAPARVLELAHERLRGSRGAAVAIGALDDASGVLRFAGIGNVAVRVLSGDGSRSLVSLNGTVGVQIPRPKEFEIPWPLGALLIAHSDGLNTRWDLRHDPMLAARDPAIVAGVLYREYARGTDDLTVLVGRRVGSAPAQETPR